MDPVIISIIALIMFIALLLLGMHIGISLALSGFVGMILFRGMDAALAELKVIPWNTAASFSFSVIPLFMLMGNFAFSSGISGELFDTCYKWLGRFRGGLGYVGIGACSLFHCLCGSATATTATMGMVCLPEMRKYNYKDSFSTSVIAASGAFGLLIPPSVGFIVYATVAQISVGKQFAAGIIPAIVCIILACITVSIVAKRDPNVAPRGAKFTLKERMDSLKGLMGFGILFILVLGGIFSGFISPSEGGAIGAFGAFVIMLIRRRATVAGVVGALKDSMKTTAMIFMIMVGANIFGTFLAMTALPKVIASALSTLGSGYAVLWVIIAIWLVLGMFIDTLPLIIILTPIFWPVVELMQWNPYWFGIIMVMCMLIGLITPPVGMSVYVIAGISKTPIMTVFKGSVPFIICLVIALIVLVYVPSLSTWLPSVTAAM